MTVFRIGEAADLLGVSADTVRRWVDGGRLAATRDEHGHRVIEGVDLAGFVPGLRTSYGDFYTERSIPATMYGLGRETATIGVPNFLVVREDMPEATAYALTRLLFTAKPTLVAAHPEALHLDQRAALDTFPLRLHPGAARYYREAKP